MTELQLDHIVVAAPDLELAKAEFARTTGVAPIDGGPHPGRGTCNALVSFGASSYLEIIAPDPQQTLAGTNGAKFAELREPELLHWAVRTTDLEAVSLKAKQAGLTPGAIYPMSRNTPQGGFELALNGLGRPHSWRLAAVLYRFAGFPSSCVDCTCGG